MAYATKDRDLVEEIKEFLTPLLRQNPSVSLYEIDVLPGMETEIENEQRLLGADIILLMVSEHFLASEYCYSRQVKLAVSRYHSKDAWVIPVILRPCLWEITDFGRIEPLPRNRKPVTDSHWRPKGAGRLEVVKGIQVAVNHLQSVIPIRRPPPEDTVG
jgi:hypothetical protein